LSRFSNPVDLQPALLKGQIQTICKHTLYLFILDFFPSHSLVPICVTNTMRCIFVFFGLVTKHSKAKIAINIFMKAKNDHLNVADLELVHKKV
jgi:hypothetical protein